MDMLIKKEQRVGEQEIKRQTVALLMGDILVAQKFSNIFRKMGVFAHYYFELKDFWDAILEECPLFAIIDVKKMSSGDIILKNHPLVQDEELPIAFYFTKDCRPLLFSTAEIFHFGLIEEENLEESSYEKSLKSILKRVNKSRYLLHEISVLQQQLHESKIKNSTMLIEAKKNHEIKQVSEKFFEIESLIESIPIDKTFLDICNELISSWDLVTSFSLLQIDFKREILYSPDLNGKKYNKLPPFNIEGMIDNGISFLTQNMAYELANKYYNDSCMALGILGHLQNPEILLYLTVDAQFYPLVDWKRLEILLSALNMRMKLYEKVHDPLANKSIINLWQMLSIIDDHFFHSTQSEKCILVVGINKIFEEIKLNTKYLFKWNDFNYEFCDYLKKRNLLQYNLTFMSPSKLIFFVDKKEVEGWKKIITEIFNNLDYTKFFSGAIKSQRQNSLCNFRVMTLSALGLLQYLSQEDEILPSSITRVLEQTSHSTKNF